MAMPDVGRIVVASSAVLAVAAAVGFGVVVTSRPDLRVDGGGTICMPSATSGSAAFGLGVENRGDGPVTLGSIEANTTSGLASIDYAALPPRRLDDETPLLGTATLDDVPDWSSRRPVAGTLIPAHSRLTIAVVPRLASSREAGYVRGFTLHLTGGSGVEHAYPSALVMGFPSGSGETAAACDR